MKKTNIFTALALATSVFIVTGCTDTQDIEELRGTLNELRTELGAVRADLDAQQAEAADAAAGDGFGDPAKVVWHVDYDDVDRLSAMLGSINNMVQTYENRLIDYDVRIVFLAGGITFLTEDHMEGSPFEVEPGGEYDEERQEIGTRLLSMHNTYGVELELCDITRRAAQLDEDKIFDEVEAVESGVVRVAELQNEEGFAYLKMF